MKKIVLFLLISFNLSAQYCIDHRFRINNDDSIGHSQTFLIERNNTCPEPQKLTVDANFYNVPDRMEVYESDGSGFWQPIASTHWIGDPWFLSEPCTSQMFVGFVEYNGFNMIGAGNFLPGDYHLNTGGTIAGCTRINLESAADSILLIWYGHPCYQTHTDIKVKCHQYLDNTPFTEHLYETTCNKWEAYLDTIFTDCGYSVFENEFFPHPSRVDTICGLIGTTGNFQGTEVEFSGNYTITIENIRNTCEVTDTLHIISENVYLPDCVSLKETPPNNTYQTYPTTDMLIYDRWGNLIYEGRQWQPEHVGVFTVVCFFKGNKLIEDITVIN